MKTTLLVSVLSVSLLMPGLCAGGISGKLSNANLAALASAVKGETTSVLKDMRRLLVPVIALTITYEKVIKPGSIVAYREVRDLLAKGDAYDRGILSLLVTPVKLLKSLWNLPSCDRLHNFANFFVNRAATGNTVFGSRSNVTPTNTLLEETGN